MSRVSEFFKKSHSLKKSLSIFLIGKNAIHNAFSVNKDKYYIRKLTYLKTWLYEKGIFISNAYM